MSEDPEAFKEVLTNTVKEEILNNAEWEFELDQEGSADLLNDLMGEMMEWERDGVKVLQPAIVYSDVPYAPLVEFGTGPYKEAAPNYDNAQRRKDMERWVQKRLNETDNYRIRKLALAFMNKIDKEGIAPSPVFRSSLAMVERDLLESGNGTTFFEEKGGSIKEFADILKEEIERTLRDNGMEISGDLLKSIHSELIDSYSIVNGEVKVEEGSSGSDITEDMWADQKLGREGKRPTKYWRGAS